jgi:ABC-type transport system involved in multi-copper enzyme maturation permease subunit
LLAVIALYLGGAIAYCGRNMLQTPDGPRLADLLRSGPEIAERAMLELTWTQMLAMLVLLPGLGASAISEEDRRGTMADLFATPLSGGAIVFGKLARPLLLAAIILLVALPVITPAVCAGLLSIVLVARAWLMLAVLAIFVVSLSVLVAAVVTRPHRSIPTAYCVVAAWLLVPIWLTPVVRGLSGPWAWVKMIDECALLSHPSEAAMGLSIPWTRLYGSPSTDIGSVWLGLSRLYIDPSGRGLIWGALPRTLTRVVVSQSLAAAFCLVAAALCLRGRRLGLRGWGTHWPWIPTRRPAHSAFPSRDVGDDPMLWKERTAAGRPSRTAVGIGIALLCGTMLVPLVEQIVGAFSEWSAVWAGNDAGDSKRSQLNESLRSVSAMLYMVSLLIIATAATARVTGERDRGSWTALLACPLTGWEVARAKVLGAVWEMRWLALPFGLIWIIGLLTGSIHPLGFLTAGVSAIVFGTYAAALGVCCSMLLATSDRAILATLGILLVSNTFPLLLIPLDLIGSVASSRAGLFLAGVTPFVHWISLVSPIELGPALNGWPKEGTIRLPFTFWTIRLPLQIDLIRIYGISILFHLVAALVTTGAAAWAFEARRGASKPRASPGGNSALGESGSRGGHLGATEAAPSR